MSDPASPVVTRIAPSPTGMMHIGTARTALFNWLYARHTGGKFLIRVEDTDRERTTPDAVQAIFDGMDWLGLQPDEAPIFQTTRAERHREVALDLLERGGAYQDYMTIEELAAERERARAEGRPIHSPWRDQPPRSRDNQPFTVRLRAPRKGETIVHDLVKGDVVFKNRELDDLVLLRADGSPTYNLAVVADDHDMGITHVIRGDDHLANTPRQIQIYRGMGWELPRFGHLPMIHGPDGAKLSKRHGAQGVREFADLGYLPEAMRNYLARLGWGHGDDEIFTDSQAIEWFDIVNVVSAPARLDWPKLNHINQHYIREAEEERLQGLVIDILKSREVQLPADFAARLARAIPLVKEGAKTLLELADLTLFALKPRPIQLDDKAKGLLTEEVQTRLRRLSDRLAAEPDWSSPPLHVALKTFADEEGGFGKFGPALRPILAAGAVAPDLASALAALGQDESLGRIEDALSQVQ